jgi:HSP20 family protein
MALLLFLEAFNIITKREAQQGGKMLKKNKKKDFDKIELEETNLDSMPELSESSDDWMEETEGQLAIDVYQNANDVVVKAPIAGVKAEDIEISINDDVVTVKGQRKQEKEVKNDDYYVQECYWGAFSRSVILPVAVNVDKSNAKLKDGILTVTLPKAKSSRSKKLKVRNISSK